MKHFLRKLHIGGGGNRDDRPAPTPPSSSSPSSSSASPFSALGDWFSSLTRHNSSSGSGSQTPNNHSVAAGELRPAAAPGPPAPQQQQGGSYGSLEEEYQVQLAIALSVSDHQQSGGDPESAEIEVAKRISLGLSPAPAQALPAAYRYWAYNVLNYNEKILNGFYDVYGGAWDATYPKQLPSLLDLQREPVSSDGAREIILVNRATDRRLEELEKLACEANPGGEDPVKNGVAQRIAEMVADHMGGPVENDVDMAALWKTASWELRTSFQSNVLSLGSLHVGLARHRALLFKVLADCVGIPCRLLKGKHHTGVDDGAVNIIRDGDGREFIIDLMGAPGALIPADAPSAAAASSQPHPIGPRHHSEPADIEQAIAATGPERRAGASHVRSPSWTEGIGAPELRSSKAQDMSQYMIDAAKENPRLAQKLHDVFVESGVDAPPGLLAELSPKDHQLAESAEKRAVTRVARLREKGKPPLKSRMEDTAKERLQRLRSVEGLGDRRPLGTGEGSPVGTAASVLTAVHENFPSELIKNSPVAVSAITAAVVASSMVVAAAKSDSESNLEVPISAAATATAAVVAATSAAVVLKAESGSGGSDKSGSWESKKKALEDAPGSGGSEKRTDEESAEDEKVFSGSSTKSQSLMPDVAEWEIFWDELAVGERIGLGSYGEVYRGDWHGTAVAIKKFLHQDVSGDALEEFKTEVRLMKRMRHPNVVLFMGAVTRAPNLSIVTEFLPRGSLFKLLHRPSSQLDERRRLRMALDVAKGMNYLHTSTPTIVHRDLKSPNLLVDKNWVVKVCDFGLSRMKHNTFLSSKSQAGTPEWMAPEVLRNEPSNEKADVYSFGVILWELVTQQQPWHGMNPMQVVAAVGFQNRRLDISPDLDPAISKIILDCWQSEPHLRPSFSDIMRSLRPFQKPVIPSQKSSD